jgi:hypothetical protein
VLKSYLKKITEVASQGDAREESYYSLLEGLLKAYAESIDKGNVRITTLPKKTEAGNPDFRVWDGTQHIIGYIEAKPPTTEYLDQIETTGQLKRYLHTFPNLILTNFFEFRLYRDGALVDKVLIGRPFVAHQLKTVPPVEKGAEFLKLLEKFFSFSLPRVYEARTLATELAKRTHFLKDEVVTQELREEEKAGKGFIFGFYQAFRQYLISDLSIEAFADLYSQTITYGLFAARTRSMNGFNRRLAYDSIPHTIGILRDVFRFVSLEDPPPQMEWIIDDLSEVLAITDVKSLLHQYFHEDKGRRDPVIHFYETFLAEYDPITRERRGVYYTPEPVVSYIVRSLHSILKKDFDRQDGFASTSVTVLDPAAGTLTFLAEASKLAVEEFISRYGEGGRENLIKEHLLKDFYAFELMMAPYAVGHLKMSFLLEELGYSLQKEDRFKLYLTNTLEMEELAQTDLPGMASLSKESHLAGQVKKEQPILVILGNPPYSGHSYNLGEWITKEIKAYYQVDGRPLGEKNPKWLQDDYVKFLRFAQWKIDTAGEGVLGFITNHSYLDNPTFRGMRQSLMNSFNEIYILDLHGNTRKKERCPDGSKDENVFDIQQGVAIALFIKRRGEKKGCRVHHSEIWGLQERKYDWLLRHDVETTQWRKLSPRSEFYLFIPRDERLSKTYEKFQKITDLFPVNSVGIVTARDNLTIRWTSDEVWSTVLNFSKIDKELARRVYNLGKDSKDWSIEKAQKDLKESGLNRKKIVPILYRPFDVRYAYYTGTSGGFHCRPRPEVMRHMMQENLAMCVGRAGQVVGLEHGWNIAFCSKHIEDLNLFYRGGNVNFPLYLYPEKKDNPEKRSSGGIMMLFESQAEYGTKRPNLSPALMEQLTKAFKKTPSPEQIFFYIYAVLYSNTYRTRYAEFLKLDFPRIPFTSDYKLFCKMAGYGERLAALHLLKSPKLDPPIAKFQGKGDYVVEKVRYEQAKIYISEGQYFENVEEEVWQYQIGGYQVCNKYLKDRKGRRLSLDDIRHYCKLITALQKTIRIQKEIDRVYPQVEKDTLIEDK